MKISINSDEFKAWHEVGHATVCLHLGGDLDGIEFLEVDSRGSAVAHCCDVMPDMERSVACGGYAAEFYLVQAGYVDWVDLQEISAAVLGNAWRDRQDFAGRTVTEDNDFTKEEDEEFVRHATQARCPDLPAVLFGDAERCERASCCEKNRRCASEGTPASPHFPLKLRTADDYSCLGKTAVGWKTTRLKL